MSSETRFFIIKKTMTNNENIYKSELVNVDGKAIF